MHVLSAYHDHWKIDTRDSFRTLCREHDAVNNDRDPFAWLLKQAGHLNRREFDQVDLPKLIDHLTDEANRRAFLIRGCFRDIVQHLILLSTAPEADAEVRTNWKREVSFQRIKFQSILRKNPSLRRFLPAIYNFGWAAGRMHASMDLSSGSYLDPEIRQEVLQSESVLGDWSERLTTRCPWSPSQVVGFDPDDPHDALTDSYALPFDEPSR